VKILKNLRLRLITSFVKKQDYVLLVIVILHNVNLWRLRVIVGKVKLK